MEGRRLHYFFSSRFLLAATALVTCAGLSLAQDKAADAPLVDLGQPVELHLGGGQTKNVRIGARAGDYLQILALSDSQLVVKTSLFDTAGNLVAVTPSLGGTGGSAQIAAYAGSGGDFRLQISSQMPSAEARSCTITLAVRHPADETERADAEAHRAFAKAAAQAASGGAQGMRAAVAQLDQPIGLARRAGDNVLELRAVFGKGQFLAMLGDLPAALPFFQESLELSKKSGDKRAEAHTLDDIGLVETNLERYSDAIQQFNQALELQHETGQPWETALTLANMAEAESALGRVDLALEALERQEQIRKQISDQFGLCETWLGMADVYLMTGDPEHALEKLVESLPYWPRFRDKEDGKESEIATYQKLGAAYSALGDYDAAANAMRTALKLARELGSKRITAETLVAEAQLYPLHGNPAQALQISERALKASEAAEYQRGEELALVESAKVHTAEGQARQAVASLETALGMATKLEQPYDEANARQALGSAEAALGEAHAAEREYEAALAVERRLGDRFGEVQTLVGSARLEEKMQQPERALSNLEEALAAIDRTRSSLAAPELRARYLASQRAAYELSARILTGLDEANPGKGYGARAFDVSERAHARSLLDALGDETHGELDRPADRELAVQLNAVDASLHALASRDESLHREARIGALLTKRGQLELEVQSRRTSSGAAGESVAPIPLAAIREKLLDKDTVLLEYLTGSEQSHLWVLSHSGFQHYGLPGEAALDTAVRRLYDALTAADHLPANLPIADRAAKLDAADQAASREASAVAHLLLPMPAAVLGKGPLLIVADGPVQMAPFSYLPAPGNPERRLGSIRSIAIEPSASVLARIREKKTPATNGRVLIVADPIYSRSDPRFAGGATRNSPPVLRAGYGQRLRGALDQRLTSLPRLPMSRVEAEDIAKLAAGRTTELLDFNAEPVAFERLAADRFSIIHIATHTVLDDRHPDLSGLVLSLVNRQGRREDGFVPLLDIYKLRLQAHLVVLSACESYIGNDLRGEGLLGLARGFLYAGARQVMGSLWKVDDRATAVFMQRFYTALLRDNLSAAAALSRTQDQMSQDPAWRSPRFWAGFVLEGDLR